MNDSNVSRDRTFSPERDHQDNLKQGADSLLKRIVRKKGQIRDAQGWVQDLKDLGETDPQQIFNATNYVATLQTDLHALKAEGLRQGREIF